MKKMTVARFAAVLTAAFVAVAGFAVPTNVKAANSIEVTGGDSFRDAPTVNREQYYDVNLSKDGFQKYFAFTTSDREDSTYTFNFMYVDGIGTKFPDCYWMYVVDENGQEVVPQITISNSNVISSSQKTLLEPGTTYYIRTALGYYWNMDNRQYSQVTLSFRVTENISAKSKAQMNRDKDDEDSDDKNTGDDTSISDDNNGSDTDTDTDDDDDDDDDEDDEDEIDYESLKEELSVSPSVIKGHKKNTKKIKVVTNEAVERITYTSANKKIAKVTKNGKVKLLKKGKTKITVRFYCGDGDVISAKVTVKVV